MTKGLKIYIISYILIIFGLGLAAQNHEDGTLAQHGTDAENNRSGHKITLVMANSLINNSFSDQTNGILIVPTIGFNYDYFLNSRWGLGLHTDILLQQYKVEKHENFQMIRTGVEYGVGFSKMLGRTNI